MTDLEPYKPPKNDGDNGNGTGCLDTLTLPLEQVTFPHRCVRCGAPPTRAVTMSARQGLNLGVMWVGRTFALDLPFCNRCTIRTWAARSLWFVAPIILYFATFIAAFELLEPEQQKSRVFPIALLTGLLAVGVWYRSPYEGKLFHRLFSPLWIQSFNVKNATVIIGFRDERLRREVGHHAGLLDVHIPSSPTSASVDQLRVPWKPEPQPPRWWVVALVGLGFGLFGIVEFVRVDASERDGRAIALHSLEYFLYWLGGKWLLAGTFVALGCLVVKGAFVIRKRNPSNHEP